MLYMSLLLLCQGPKHFKAGVAVAPVCSWQLYDSHYTERFMATPELNPEGYATGDIRTHLDKLESPLLLMQGMADDNVLFTHSTMLYKHLQDLAIPFETMDYPGKKHSIRGKQTGIHLYKTITNFFNRNLHPTQE